MLTDPTSGVSAIFRFQCLQIPEQDSPAVPSKNVTAAVSPAPSPRQEAGLLAD